MSGSACEVYERLAQTELAIQGLRPGGLTLTERAVDLCNFSPNSTILDVGCGSAATLNHLAFVHNLSAIGLDSSSRLLNQARLANQALLLVRGGGQRLPFPDESADGIFAECSLSVMDDPGRALDEFRRVLKIGGKLILSDVYSRNPEASGQLGRMAVDCCLKGAVPLGEILERLTSRSFHIDLLEDHTDFLTQFAVQLVFSYGSMNEFWLKAGSDSIDPKEMERAVSDAEPGYFLLIAEKNCC